MNVGRGLPRWNGIHIHNNKEKGITIFKENLYELANPIFMYVDDSIPPR
jgi:hypothetical protein